MSYGTVQAEKMTTESGYSLGAGNASSFKNRLINGGMVIDQRNNGTSINSTPGSTVRPVDRFFVDNFNSGTVACQRSTTAPAGFSNSLSLTVSSADTPAAGDYLLLSQQIEGYNVADFNWGTANAQAITLSFWIRSSVTGTYGAGIRGGSPFQSYPFSYTVNAANTWEQKSITIPGPTSGTFDTINGSAFQVIFDLGSGTDFSGTANTWQSGSDWRVAGSLAWVSNSGATLFITGVQIEAGTVATSFDFRSIGTELSLCLRYYEELYTPHGIVCSAYNTTDAYANISYSQKRTAPTLTLTPNGNFYSANSPRTVSSVSGQNVTTNSFQFKVVASGLTPGYAGHYDSAATNMKLSAEL